MKYARVISGLVVELIDAGTDDIDTLYHPDIVATLVDDDGAAVEGGTWDGSVFGPAPTPVPAPTNDEIYDQVIKNQAVIKAVVLSYIKGELTVGMTGAQAKTAVVARM